MSVTEWASDFTCVSWTCGVPFCSGALQIAAGLANANVIVLAEAVEQLNALLEHAIQVSPMRILNVAGGLMVPSGSESGKQAFFVFHNILAGIHSLSTGMSTFALVGDSHFDTVGKSSQPFKFLATQRDLVVAAPKPRPA